MRIAAPSLLSASAFLFSSCNDQNGPKDDNTSDSNGPGIGTVGGVELKIDLPKEKLAFTPHRKRLPNLILAPKKFPKFLVPEGSVNLSKGKKVTSSDNCPILGDLTLVTDGDKGAEEGCFVELMDGKQWVQIDLEKSVPLYAIVVWHHNSDRRAYHDVVVKVSNDPTFKSGVSSIYNNDYDNSSGMGKGKNHPYVESKYGLLINGKGTEARYVRLYSNGNTVNGGNHYIEVEVYGKPE